MFWGCISFKGVGDTTTTKKVNAIIPIYLDEVQFKYIYISHHAHKSLNFIRDTKNQVKHKLNLLKFIRQ